MDGEALLGRAERVVEQGRSRGIEQVECYLEWGEGLDVELEKGRVANTGSSQGGGGCVRVVVDGRLGFAYFSQVRQASVALQKAVRASRHGERLGYHLPSGAKARPLAGRWDEGAAAMDAEAAIAMARDLVQGGQSSAPKALLSGGGVGMDAGWRALASSEGVLGWDRTTGVSAAASLVQEDGARSISASNGRSSHRLDVDAQAVAMEAGETLLALRRPGKPVGGRLDVLFRPEAAAELVTDLVVSASMGDEARRGKTVWSRSLGKQVAARRLSVVDDSRLAGAVGGVPFDDEGLPTRRLPIIEAGVLRNFLYDSWDAHRHGARSTRSAVRGDFKGRPTTGTHHIAITGTGARPMEKLLGSVDDGYLVDSVLGAHTANATTGDFSITAPNVWRIRNGEVAGPVREVAIAGNLPDLLMRVRGHSTEARQMDGLRVPHLLFADVNVSC